MFGEATRKPALNPLLTLEAYTAKVG